MINESESSEPLDLRVVRGTHWKRQDQDGGEGNSGTVVELSLTSPKTAIVQWDSKSAMDYRAGDNERYDLKVYDSELAGIKRSYSRSACDPDYESSESDSDAEESESESGESTSSNTCALLE